MENCVFCKIVSGEIPYVKIYEDEFFLAFLDINPISPGHTLVIPKEHYKNIFEINSEPVLDGYFSILKKVSIAIKTATSASGIKVYMDNGSDTNQVIMHCHVHLVPRFDGDGLEMRKGQSAPWDSLEKIGADIKKELI